MISHNKNNLIYCDKKFKIDNGKISLSLSLFFIFLIMKKIVTVIGLGYVGSATAIAIASSKKITLFMDLKKTIKNQSEE